MKKRKVETKLLRSLARYLERKVKDEKFDMNSWCGTSACAFGHAPYIPAIAKKGLIVDKKYFSPYLSLTPSAHENFVNAGFDPYFLFKDGNNVSYETHLAQYIFGISRREANHIFIPKHIDSANTRRAVIARIRKVIEKHEGAS